MHEYQELAAEKYVEISRLNGKVKNLEKELIEARQKIAQLEELSASREREIAAARKAQEDARIRATKPLALLWKHVRCGREGARVGSA